MAGGHRRATRSAPEGGRRRANGWGSGRPARRCDEGISLRIPSAGGPRLGDALRIPGRGSQLARRANASAMSWHGVIDCDPWHPSGVAGTELLYLVATEERRRARWGLGSHWLYRPWRSDRFRSASEGYWRGRNAGSRGARRRRCGLVGDVGGQQPPPSSRAGRGPPVGTRERESGAGGARPLTISPSLGAPRPCRASGPSCAPRAPSRCRASASGRPGGGGDPSCAASS